jgi:hypothetical protein
MLFFFHSCIALTITAHLSSLFLTRRLMSSATHKWSDGKWHTYAEDSEQALAEAATLFARYQFALALQQCDSAASLRALSLPEIPANICLEGEHLFSLATTRNDGVSVAVLLEVLNILLANGADINAVFSPVRDYTTTLGYAVEADNLTAVEALVAVGASLDTSVSKRGQTLLARARSAELRALLTRLIHDDASLSPERRAQMLTQDRVTWFPTR